MTVIAAVSVWVFLVSARLTWANRLGALLHLPSLERFEADEFAVGLRMVLNRLAGFETQIQVLIVIVFAALSVFEGGDRTYDLLNYHYVNGFLALHPGFQNIGASGIQGFFNPLIDVPTYLGYRYFSPAVVLFGFGLVQGLAFPLIYRIARTIGTGKLTAYFAAGCGAFSALAMSEMGLSLGDTTLAPLILLAVLLIVRVAPDSRTTVPFVAAGFLVALATGLKLTTAPFLFGIVALVWFFTDSGRRIRRSLLLILGAAVGGLISFGWWAWHLLRIYHNPFYPMYNQYFRSSFAGVGLNNGVDDRVHGVAEFFYYPFEIMVHPLRTGAGAMRDYGFPVVEILLVVAAAWWAVRSVRAGRPQRVFNFRVTRALCAFYLATYVVWVETTGIFRYMAPLEMLSFLMIAVLLGDLGATFDFTKVVPWVVGLCFAAISLTQLSPIWMPRIPAPSSEFTVTLPALLSAPRTSVVFADGAPNTWIVPFLSHDDFVTRVYNWQITPLMAGLISSSIARTGNPVAVWTDGSTVQVIDSRLALVNLKLDTTNCATFQGTAGGPTYTFAACRAITVSGG